ncbi:MAG TPA: hypothetical protein VFA06_21310 [Actinocrinis sp.]|uniref:hypothetical protein n=1 Tax=Actinocrinis sp. TaxID=1920516 RepID=UPI002D60B816|nr:hypothetical protein [Actinocrinis sp.]HZU58432.1 hypothetical protein [Actinocrinis sp.]
MSAESELETGLSQNPRVRIRTGRILLAVGMAAAGIAAAPSAAQAYVPDQPPCYGATCVGKSPYITNRDGESCVTGVPGANNGATSIAYVDAPGDGTDNNRAILRWSSFCGANWAKWEGSSPGYADYWAQSGDGHKETPEGSGYTYMVDGTQVARACVVPYTFGEYAAACTGWY